MNPMPRWETYEEVTAYLLDQIARDFGLECVEGKQCVAGLESGTAWEIDAKGICEGQTGFLIVECRRYTTSKVKQKDLAALAYQIIDTGAKGGIIVTPLDVQEGARRVAKAKNIEPVQLDKNSTTTDYILKFLNKIMISRQASMAKFSASLEIEVIPGERE